MLNEKAKATAFNLIGLCYCRFSSSMNIGRIRDAFNYTERIQFTSKRASTVSMATTYKLSIDIS